MPIGHHRFFGNIFGTRHFQNQFIPPALNQNEYAGRGDIRPDFNVSDLGYSWLEQIIG